MPKLPRALKSWTIFAAVVAVVACEVSRTPGGIQGDTQRPSVTLVVPPGSGTGTVPDTQAIQQGLRYNLDAADNFGLKRVTITFTGGYTATEDSIFTVARQTFTQTRTISFPASSPVGGLITIIARAVDGANNVGADTLLIFLSNVNALQVFLLAPSAGALAGQNLYIPIVVSATQNSGVRKIGWQVVPAGLTAQTGDSINVPLPYPDSITFTDSVQVTGASGTFQVYGFAEDSAGRRVATAPITVTIQSPINDLTPPQVQHFVALRVEVSDTITVHATDPSGIKVIGFEVWDTNGTTLLKADSIVFATATTTDVTRRFLLNLSTILGFIPPRQVIVNGFAVDGATAANRGVSSIGFVASGAPDRDTLTVVFGQTRGLPAGGRIMDMAVDSTRNEIYLTNIQRDRLEVFTLVGDSFLTSIPLGQGAKPWGLALWPANNSGGYNDTVVVAASGGTYLAIVDVRPAVRREIRRHRLPNFLVQKISTTLENGVVKVVFDDFDLSDRPQNVGLTRFGTDVFAVYSTAPTPSQANPFTNRGTLRWENLDTTVALTSHVFYEHAGASANPFATDTLQIILDRPWKALADTLRTDTIVCAATGFIVDFEDIGFADTTFVRNSGDFTHAFMGEGENVGSRFARVLNYQPAAGVFTDVDLSGGDLNGDGIPDVDCTTTYIDLGISQARRVSDFVSNTATRVIGIAVNFNGLTNMVRTRDSVYIIDEGLRLAGTIQGTGINPGLDIHRDHRFDPFVRGTPIDGGSLNPDSRLVYVAREEPVIEVYDTYVGGPQGLVASLGIRDPIIGPLRLARTATGQVIVGVTARGVVTVRVPAFVNPNPAPRPVLTGSGVGGGGGQ